MSMPICVECGKKMTMKEMGDPKYGWPGKEEIVCRKCTGLSDFDILETKQEIKAWVFGNIHTRGCSIIEALSEDFNIRTGNEADCVLNEFKRQVNAIQLEDLTF